MRHPEKKACDMSQRELARYIDQFVLKPEFTDEDIRRYIQEGVDFGCATVCVNPSSLPIAQELTAGTETGICVVCDFPFGNRRPQRSCRPRNTAAPIPSRSSTSLPISAGSAAVFSVKQFSSFSSSKFPIVIVGKSPLSAGLVRKQVPLLHPAA